ncbi:hypothetical protein [Nocardiopsis sp. JB363]|uniref:hypothetical protein n=1 Tax=Nocardiopsis sp. JB363 TaxID=1434837 RepID=UPI000B35AB14|nr:hypothetical protein [Nocardiopsis sp. JB363]
MVSLLESSEEIIKVEDLGCAGTAVGGHRSPTLSCEADDLGGVDEIEVGQSQSFRPVSWFLASLNDDLGAEPTECGEQVVVMIWVNVVCEPMRAARTECAPQ